MSMAKAVVVMTVYRNDTLKDFKMALESIYSQSIREFDIFVQEDGPVPDEIDTYLNQELSAGKITYLGKREANRGFDYSLNELIRRALSENYTYIIRMDADDISVVDRIEKQISHMQTNPDIDILGTYIQEFGDGIKYDKLVKYPLTHNAMLHFFKKRVPLAHVSVVFRDVFFKKAGLYTSEGHINNGDTLMWMNGFASKCQFANLDFVGVRVRVTQDFFGRRGGLAKAYSDFKNRLEVNRTLGYNYTAYVYAIMLFVLNVSPGFIKKILYKRLR